MRPCIFRHSPGTVTFYIHIINPPNDLKKPSLPPLCAPSILNFPIRNIDLHPKANNFNIMIDTLYPTFLKINPRFILLFKLFTQWHSTYNRTSRKYLHHHLTFSAKVRIFRYAVDWIRFRYITISIRPTSFTPDPWWASHSIIPSNRLIRRTSTISNIKPLNILKNKYGLTTMTSVVFCAAREQNLCWDCYVWPLGFPQDFYAVWEHGGRGEGPAGATVEGDVLALQGC